MTYPNYTGSFDDDQALVAYMMLLFGHVRDRRVNFEVMWEETASLCWPEYRNSFTFGHNRPPGMKYTEYQVDTSGSIASHRFMSIADTLITPMNMMWSRVECSDKSLMKQRAVKVYYEQVSKCLWYHRYRPEANFVSENQKNWQQLGVFGNMGMLIEPLDIRPGHYAPGLRYVSTSVGEMYYLVNHQGRIDGYIRTFRWTARQAYQRWGDKIPLVLKTALEQNSMVLWDFMQVVQPRHDYDPFKVLSSQGKPWASTYLSIAGYAVLEKGGYRSFPWAGGRYMVAPEEDYGRGPGQMSLPALKTLNAEKADYLKQGHLAGTPAYLIADDGLLDFKTHPGAYNYGGVDSQGRKLVDILPTGNIQVTQEMMAEEKKAVDDAFLVSLFPMLFGSAKGPQLSARQVIEMANEKGIFLAPLGKQYTEYCGPMIDRELDLLSYQRLLPKLPPELKEATGEYENIFSSPIAKSVRGQPVAGFMRAVEMGNQIVQAGGDPSVMDQFDFTTAVPAIAESQMVPAEWMASKKQIAQKAQMRAKAQQADAAVKALPGQAAIMKAKAIQSKAATGGNIGGTLSGTAAGGMPMLPGQTQPGGSNFGTPGPQGP